MVENETNVITAEVDKTQEGLNDAANISASIEDHFGSKERASEYKSQVKPTKKPDKEQDQTLNNKENKEQAKPIVTELDDQGKAKVIPTADNQKDDKFFDPFHKKDGKAVDGKDKTPDNLSDKKTADSINTDGKTITSVDKSKEDIERDSQFQPLKEFHEKYKTVVEHPLVTAILQTGLPVVDALQKLQPKDYSLKSEDPNEQEEIEKWRATEYFATVDKLKGQELKDSVDEYLAMDEGISKRRERSAQITALDAAQSERIQSLTKESASVRERKSQNIQKLDSDINKFIQTVTKEGNLFGMQLADGKAKTLEEGLKGFFKDLFNTDGSVNLEPIVAAVYFQKFHKEAMREKLKKVESKTTHDVLADVVQLDDNNQSVTNVKTKVEDNLEALIDENFSNKAK